MRISGEFDRKFGNIVAGEVSREIITALDAPATFKELTDKTRIKANELAVSLNRLLEKKRVKSGFKMIRDEETGRFKEAVTVWSRTIESNSNPQTS